MKSVVREILLVLGYASVVTGISLLHVPTALIIGGAGLVWLSMPNAKKGGK